MLKDAIVANQVTFRMNEILEKCGEIFFQQHVYVSFGKLLVSATAVRGLQYYKAAQEVHSSLLIVAEGNQKHDCGLLFSPDSAVVLGSDTDAFGMMEMKPLKQHWLDHQKDCMRYLLMVASTSQVVDICLQKIHKDDEEQLADARAKVALPFLLAFGEYCVLYDVLLDGTGGPCIRRVLLHEESDKSEDPSLCNFQSPSVIRSRLFVALAVILNQFCRFL